MSPTNTILFIILLFFLSCKAASSNKEQKDELFDAIADDKVQVQDLDKILEDFRGDINEKIFTIDYDGSEYLASPLELAIACKNTDKMIKIIEAKHPIVDIDIFDITFKSNCESCFNVLLDNSELNWYFNQKLFVKLLFNSKSSDQYLAFMSIFLRRLSLMYRLAIIENAFNTCTDTEKIILTVEAVILDLAQRKALKGYSENDERTAVISFTRAMIFKKDYDSMLPWIESLYYQYPITEKSQKFIWYYKISVKHYENRVEEYPQPEDVIKPDAIRFYKHLFNSITKNHKIKGARVFLRLINKTCPKVDEIRDLMNSTLDYVIKKGFDEYAKLLLEAGCNFSDSSIFEAVDIGSTKIVELLLDHGADIESVNNNGDTPLMTAAHHGIAEIVEVLLRRGANQHFVKIDGNTPLMAACEGISEEDPIEKVRLLLSYGALPDTPTIDGFTPLMRASGNGYLRTVELLIDHGADVNAVTIVGLTALHYAINRRRPEIVDVLLRNNANQNWDDEVDNDLLKLAEYTW